jgi:hypothetical protein
MILLIQNSIGHVTALDGVRLPASIRPLENKIASPASGPTVDLRTPAGKTIVFKQAEKDAAARTPAADGEIPHLVLNRNGVATPGYERTLHVSVENLSVPASGMYVQLILETQHGDPDLERQRNVRIRVWKEMSFVPSNALTHRGVDVSFDVTFSPVTELPHKKIRTPTDYYRCRILITDAKGNQLRSYVRDFAFLMENQWRLPLPAVQEATPGAAPEELVVYYYDMLPFQADPRDPDSRIPREDVGRYLQTELLPALVEAYQAQSNIWGFTWYEEWRNSRHDEDPKSLSLALGEHQTWYHGKPAPLGHSMISIRVDGTAGEYEGLTDGVLSTFYHELFHNHQRNLDLHFNGQASVAGKDQAWMMFSEGTAVLASSVGQPQVQFDPAAPARSYLKRANAFLGSEGMIEGGGLNRGYREIPYHTALYWRFLYENCGGITREGENPSRGMQVIRHVLETLYRGDVVDIHTSTDTVPALPLIIDRALQATPACQFDSYAESLSHFARAIYFLLLEEGRCAGSAGSTRCGFMDPDHLYQTPAAVTYPVTGDSATALLGEIPSSYGIDLVELALPPSLNGRTLQVDFASLAGPGFEFRVEVWKTQSVVGDTGPGRRAAQPDEPPSGVTENGRLTLEIPEADTAEFDGLALIITRLDPHENTETAGAYSLKFLAK